VFLLDSEAFYYIIKKVFKKMDPCHILAFDKVVKQIKQREKPINKMFNFTFEKEIQDLNKFLNDVEYAPDSVDTVHKWWLEMIAYKLKLKYGIANVDLRLPT
jgi:hypothetical protein